ncbi:MAG: T9SS type A sorting domain-containing protein [Muribaculaceae bacterium]|nr:T9SS type A sorting domain-containing protein [Muribaculaceae bacterium]
MRRFHVILALMMAMASTTVATAKVQWRETTTEVQGKSLTDPRNTDGVEIFQRNGTIIIRTQRVVQVKVFNILGQLVSQATLQPGTSELRLNTRGIYLVKIGNITQKVAL